MTTYLSFISCVFHINLRHACLHTLNVFYGAFQSTVESVSKILSVRLFDVVASANERSNKTVVVPQGFLNTSLLHISCFSLLSYAQALFICSMETSFVWCWRFKSGWKKKKTLGKRSCIKLCSAEYKAHPSAFPMCRNTLVSPTSAR